jgi:hypothetical protein
MKINLKQKPNEKNNRLKGEGGGGKRIRMAKGEVLFYFFSFSSFNCSNIKINLFRLIIQLMLNSSFKNIES